MAEDKPTKIEKKRVYVRYKPHPKQLNFHQSQAKFRAIISGIGFGKSAGGANEMIRTIGKYPKCDHLIMSPTSSIMRNATLKQFFKFCPKDLIVGGSKQERTILFANGARIIYYTADNERHINRLSGMDIGSFWLDEARLFLTNLWPMILGRLRDDNGPLRGWITTSPFAGNWTTDYFIRNQDPRSRKPINDPHNYELFTGSTLDNPYTPEEYKQNLLNTYSGDFARQEIYGEIVSFEGQVYKGFQHKLHVHDIKVSKDKTGFYCKVNDKKIYIKDFIFAGDWGFTNPMAFYIIGFDNDKRAYVLDEFYKRRVHVAEIIDWIKHKEEQYPISFGFVDPSEPEHIDQMRTQGINVYEANNEVAPGISDVTKAFEVRDDGTTGLYINNSCTELIHEIELYRYSEKKDNREEKETPLKVNDHACDSIRYGIRSYLQEHKEFIPLTDDDDVLGLM